MSTIINGLISRGLEIVSYKEEVGSSFESKPDTWENYTSYLPPWIYMLSRKKSQLKIKSMGLLESKSSFSPAHAILPQ